MNEIDKFVAVALQVSQGNPGAIQVCGYLMMSQRYFEIMEFLLKKEIVADKLWMLYKDRFDEDKFELIAYLHHEIDKKK